MSIWDNIKKLAQPYSDDEYDDYDDYDDEDYLDDYEEPEEPVRREKRRAPRRASASAPVAQDEDEDDFAFNTVPTASSAPVAAPIASAPVADRNEFSGRVLNMNHGSKQDVVLFHPSSFNDTTKAADDLCSNKAVIVNMENVDKAMARRIVDFLSGCIYAMKGDVKKIAQSAYLFCPPNINIVGDLENLQAEVESYI